MKTIISTFALACIAVTACNSSSNLKDPEYVDIRALRLVKAGILETTAGADVVYFNPNNFGMQLTRATGNVYVDDNYLGKFELEEKVQVKKNAEFVLPVLLTLDNISMVNNREIYKKKEALLRVEGKAMVKKSGFTREIPVKFERLQDIEGLKSIVLK